MLDSLHPRSTREGVLVVSSSSPRRKLLRTELVVVPLLDISSNKQSTSTYTATALANNAGDTRSRNLHQKLVQVVLYKKLARVSVNLVQAFLVSTVKTQKTMDNTEEWSGCSYIQLKEMSQDREQWRRKAIEWSSAVANRHRRWSTSE